MTTPVDHAPPAPRESAEQGVVPLNLGQIHAFCTVARRRSFALAAEDLGISTQAISKEIPKLEKSLGVRLINRDTRFRGLTRTGKIYLSHIEPLLVDLQLAVEMLHLPELAPTDAGDAANQPL
jgi:DNA-binding transcriptional LysR family regulator